MRRIEDATLSISVVTVAELRAGHLNARWGARRRLDHERWLRQFEQCGVDRSIAEAWAILKDITGRSGRACGDNDLWIAATGVARGVPVLTCDRDFLTMRRAGLDVIHLPRHPVPSGAD
ncbi:MAG TPA: PIN domain-containing protein [Conexibacter sp.]|nr:PIN domain-containing protein [Conexibacter sp.]